MTNRLGSAVGALALTLFACRTDPPPPPPAPPRITSFVASPGSIQPGETARLSFTAEGAESLELRDELGEVVANDGEGADVTPSRTTLYVLQATGPGGRDSAFAHVRVGTQLESVFLVAVPPTVQAGQPVSLVWSARGGSDVRLTDASGTAVPLTGESGLATVTPQRSTSYTLSADPGAGRPRLTRTVEVTVQPVITAFTATPPAARPGQTITLDWRSGGADSLTLEEATFGALVSDTTAADGTHAFVVPATLPGDAGVPTPLGFPLRFSLTARTATPAQLVTRELQGAVGDGPLITAFSVPRHAAAGDLIALSWQTTAQRVELRADGQLIYSTSGARAGMHTLTLRAPAEELEYELTAIDVNGLETSTRRTLSIVPAPAALTFVTPANVADPLADAQVSWTTSDASTVVIRVKDGPALFSTTASAQLAAGSTRLRLGRSATLVLEARNAAGQVSSLERAVTVLAPATISAGSGPAAPNSEVTYAWDFSAQNPLEVTGVPTAPAQATGSTAFVDLSTDPLATELFVSNRDEQLVAFTPPEGFVFPAFDDAASTFWVSTNGFLTFTATTVPRPANLDLETTTTALPSQVAPFWDNLQVGLDGSLRWRVDGTFPRRLIVQWTNMIGNGDPDSRLTFQVQLFENGRCLFVYQTLRDGTVVQSLGQSASVGVHFGQGRFHSSFGFNSAVLSEGLELAWFSETGATGTFDARVARAGTFAPFFHTSGGAWVASPVQPRVFEAESVQLTEAMPLPSAQATAGHYVELRNPGPAPIDVGGLELRVVDAGSPPWVLPSPLVIPAAGHFVVGESLVSGDNGGVQVDLTAAADQLPSGARGAMQLRIPGVAAPVSSIAWGLDADGGTTPAEGVAITTDPAALRSTPAGRYVCNRGTSLFGPYDSTGTPRAANEPCYRYRVESITPAWEDISTTGQKLFTGTLADFDDRVTNVTLSPGFPYFGATVAAMTVSTNGFVAMQLTTTSQPTNKTAPSSTAPTGTIAPFWDNLSRKASATDGSVYSQRKQGYHVVQWHHYGADLADEVVDDFNFEVKLFDTGVIEFHYDVMRAGGLTDTSDGSTATVWIEQPGGASALPISINRSAPRHSTAWRFTPQN